MGCNRRLLGQLLLRLLALVVSPLVSEEVPACPQEGVCNLSVQQLVPSATELLAWNRWRWEGWKNVTKKHDECVCKTPSVAKAKPRVGCGGGTAVWDAGCTQVYVPACETSRSWVKALWFVVLAARLPPRLPNRSPLKLLQCFHPVSCQTAAWGKSHPG